MEPDDRRGRDCYRGRELHLMFFIPAFRYGASRAALDGGGGGGSEWTPSELGAALLAWYKGDDLTGNNGDPISTWEDADGSNDLTAAGSLRATVAAADLNSLNTARFTAANSQRYAVADIFSGASAASVYIVLKLVADPAAAGGSSGLWRFGSAGDTDHWPFTDGNVYDGFGSNARKSTGNPTVSLSSAYRIIGIHSAANDWGIFIDGTSHFSTGTNTVGFDSTPWLGSNDAFDAFLDGWIAEAFFTDAKQSESDRQKAEGYLAHKWDLTANLDGGHPYKSDPPTV